jgi:hypothetical protein
MPLYEMIRELAKKGTADPLLIQILEVLEDRKCDCEHECEVSQADLDILRSDLENQIQNVEDQ